MERQFEISLSLLSSNDTKIRLDPSSSTTTIVIDDSRDEECCKLTLWMKYPQIIPAMYPVVRVGFEETSLTVSESQESVEICVNSTSPGIEENFTVNIISDIEGCLCPFLYVRLLLLNVMEFYRFFSKFLSV